MQSIQIGNLMIVTLGDGNVLLLKNPFDLKFVREASPLILD